MLQLYKWGRRWSGKVYEKLQVIAIEPILKASDTSTSFWNLIVDAWYTKSYLYLTPSILVENKY